MWKAVSLSDNLFMLKAEEIDSTLVIYFTDLGNIWKEELLEDTLLNRFQEINPTFDIKREEARKQVLGLIEHASKETEINIEKLEDHVVLNLRRQISEFYLKFRFFLAQAESDVLKRELSAPLIRTVHFLENQEEKLCDLLEKKDRELEEYRLEKGSITRKDLTTEKFERGDVDKSHKQLVLKVFDDGKFWHSFETTYGKADVETLKVDKEAWNNVKRRKKVYSSKTSLKKVKGISYSSNSAN